MVNSYGSFFSTAEEQRLKLVNIVSYNK